MTIVLYSLSCFFADHPYARFSELAIIHALNHDYGKRSIQKSIRELLEKRVMKICVDSNVLLYSVCENTRSLVLELTNLDTRQRQLLIRQISPNSVENEGYLFRGYR